MSWETGETKKEDRLRVPRARTPSTTLEYSQQYNLATRTTSTVVKRKRIQILLMNFVCLDTVLNDLSTSEPLNESSGWYCPPFPVIESCAAFTFSPMQIKSILLNQMKKRGPQMSDGCWYIHQCFLFHISEAALSTLPPPTKTSGRCPLSYHLTRRRVFTQQTTFRRRKYTVDKKERRITKLTISDEQRKWPKIGTRCFMGRN